MAFVSHHITGRFENARPAQLHEELTFSLDEQPRAVFAALGAVHTVRGNIAHRVVDATLRDETGLGLALTVPASDARVTVTWPEDLQMHTRPELDSGATLTLDE